jgi:lactate dehydrogenase-like 2-hydroxyacid dehydrogenase
MASKYDLISVGKGMLLPLHVETLQKDFTIHYLPGAPAERTAFLAPLADKVRFLQTTGFNGADAALINALPKLEIIACIGVGVDAIDLKAAKARGVAVTNTPEVLNDCVADLAMGLMIGASRRLAFADRYVRSGEWAKKGAMPVTSRVTGKRLGIIGLGKIGKEIATRAKGFRMEIGYHGRNKQPDAPYKFFDDAAKLAAESDFIVVICPGGEATRHIVNEKVMRALGPKGILINVSRGSTVDEAALIKTLREGALGGAALDVFAQEPTAAPELSAMDNVILAPHVGSATVETRIDMGNLAIANLVAHMQSKKLLTPVI